MFYRPQFARPVLPYQPRYWRASAHVSQVWVRQSVVNLAGALVTSLTGIEALIWHGVSGSANANPFEVITGVSFDVSGNTAFQISSTGLNLFDPITVQLVKPGSPNRFACRTFIPSYE